MVAMLISTGGSRIPMPAQSPSDPLSGLWIGSYGPSPGHRVNVSVDLKWDGKDLTGVVSPGPITLQKTSFDAGTRAIHFEADAFFMGSKVRYVMDGTLDKDALIGKWKHGNKKGDFILLKK
jgi:hypothetical protein